MCDKVKKYIKHNRQMYHAEQSKFHCLTKQLREKYNVTDKDYPTEAFVDQDENIIDIDMITTIVARRLLASYANPKYLRPEVTTDDMVGGMVCAIEVAKQEHTLSHTRDRLYLDNVLTYLSNISLVGQKNSVKCML